MLDESTGELLRILNADQSEELAASYLASQARQLFDADAVAYFRVESDVQLIVLTAGSDLTDAVVDPPAVWNKEDVLASFGLDDDSQTHGRHLDLSDLDSASFSASIAAPSRVRGWLATLRHHVSYMTVIPLRVKTDLRAVLLVMHASDAEVGTQLSPLVSRFASQAGLIIQNAQLRRQAEQAAVLQERSRLARDLHDSVTQSLYSLTLLAEATRRLAQRGDLSQVVSLTGRLGEIGQQALKEMRLLVYQLRPSMLRRIGLVRALTQRLETVERRAGVEVALLVDEDLLLPPALEEQLYYVAQEALNNALKHAAASRVQVQVESRAGMLHLQIADNGQGFAVEDAGAAGGFGLSGLRERVDKLGGDLTIASTPGQGTTISVQLPQPTMEEERMSHE